MSADAAFKAFIDRILRLKEDEDALKEDIREVYAEMKGLGYDKTGAGQLVTELRKREKNPEKFSENSAILELYRAAYERASHAHTREEQPSQAVVSSCAKPEPAGSMGDEIPATNPSGKASETVDPSADLVSPTPVRNHHEGRGSANTGGSHEVTEDCSPFDSAPEMEQTSLAAREGEKPLHSDFQPPAFLTRVKTAADYRHHCLKPDACGSSTLDHCYSCRKAIGEVEAA